MEVSIEEFQQTNLFNPDDVSSKIKMKRVGGTPTALQMSESNEWYTPPVYIEAARSVMGSIDLDPASNITANRIIRAKQYYDITSNGLLQNWPGNVWLNPSYGRNSGESNQKIWTYRLVSQYENGITNQAVLLVNAVTDRKWFQPLWNYPICFTNHRIKFYSPDSVAGSPTHGSVLVYFGTNISDFIKTFSTFGPIVRRINL